jgi:pimeloyl-ACP methyl ester carboxylesterase
MDKEIVFEGNKIFYRVYGSGKKLMLIHGFPETGHIWRNQVEHLKNKFQLVIPDLPGSGHSGMVPDMSMEGMAAVLKAIMDEESAPSDGRWVVIGHSMGGYITLALAEKHPQYLSGFGLLHSTAYADSEEKKTARRKGIEFIRQHGTSEFLKTSVPNMFAGSTKTENQALVENFLREANNFSPDPLVSYYEAMMKRPDRAHVLQNARVPVLFIMGENDTIIPLSDGLKLCSLPEKSYIHILRKSGHMGMWEEPAHTSEILEQFLNGT